ncbi:18733_t:CDS:2, partial [Acaulospora morrowiae]
NDYPLFKLSTDDDNSKLFTCSVIAHLIALCLSLPSNSSPLADYLQNLQDCQNTFILTCPSDEQTVILNALMDDGITDMSTIRYACSCGYTYVVGDCGNVVAAGTCPQCKKQIVGQGYNIAPGNSRLDQIPLTQKVEVKAQAGYLIETRKTEDNY